MFITKIGIDLGTCNSVVFLPNKGGVLQEPSVVAVTLADNKILAVGKEAKEMTGRTPDTIRIYRPLKDGVIADFRVTLAMIRYFIEKVAGRFRILKPELMIGVPAGITSTERRAVIEAGILAGAKAVYLAEEIKIKIGTALPEKENRFLEIRGRDLILGLPRNIKISSNEICDALSDILLEIIQVIKNVLRETPPELSADIIDKGMILAGGGSLLRNLPQLIAQATGVPCTLAEDPLLCVAKGTGIVLENLDIYKKSIMSKK